MEGWRTQRFLPCGTKRRQVGKLLNMSTRSTAGRGCDTRSRRFSLVWKKEREEAARQQAEAQKKEAFRKPPVAPKAPRRRDQIIVETVDEDDC
jgi:hypothetical protein